MSDLLKIAIGMIVGGLVAALLMLRGYAARPTKLSLPFIDVELSRFADLPAVKLFEGVSMAAIPIDKAAAASAMAALNDTPFVLVHSGWNIVCEAFVRRFSSYPADEKIDDAVTVLGVQNHEFLRMYRDIYTQCLQYPKAVNREFAANYLLRAPSLAERIDGSTSLEGTALARGLLMAASDEVRSS